MGKEGRRVVGVVMLFARIALINDISVPSERDARQLAYIPSQITEIALESRV
jgi:hypothetical protein